MWSLVPVGKGNRRRLARYASPSFYWYHLPSHKLPVESFSPTGHTRQNTRMKSVFSPSSIGIMRNPGEITYGIGIWRSVLNGTKRPPSGHSPFSESNALQSVVCTAPKLRFSKGTIHGDDSFLDSLSISPHHWIPRDRSFSAEWVDEEHAFRHSTGHCVWRCLLSWKVL